eukprot:jgi/Ulvmu1/1161/UM107_0035.1
MSCKCYFGCATRSNRIKWIIFAVLLTASVVFLLAHSGVVSRCIGPYQDLQKCQMNHKYSSEVYSGSPCSNEARVEVSCIEDNAGALFALEMLTLVCFIGCTIPLYMMCCCSPPPHMGDQEGYQGLELQTGRPVDQKTTTVWDRKRRGPYATSVDDYAPMESPAKLRDYPLDVEAPLDRS